jgi:integrase
MKTALGDYLDRWLTDSVRDTVRQNTWERYEQIVRLHIKPALGRVKLKSLTPTHVRALYRDKLDAGLATRTVQYIHTTLHKALKQAMNDRLVPRNVTEAVKAPRPSSKEVMPLSAGQARALLKAARGDRFEAIYVLAITAGLREGELLGLKWEDVDLGTEKLSVRRGLTITKYGPALGAPKRNKSRRSIRLTAPAAEALKRHKLTQKAERLRLGSLWEDNDLIFPNQTGGLMRPWSLTGGPSLRLLRRAGLPETTRFHDLRHTCATLLLSKGVHPKIVQELLGHASISITLDTYSHVLPNMQEKAVDAMESALF